MPAETVFWDLESYQRRKEPQWWCGSCPQRRLNRLRPRGRSDAAVVPQGVTTETEEELREHWLQLPEPQWCRGSRLWSR
ncbi:hypothetical protein J7I97_20005 [Streptomyces sp. ISL-87]|uniref:hypothetical protein n=1 Tax=Streptomyces sp. ISL-87 TaxID=2819188 RepID=UPI001BE6DF81|nr:hypothetical protein [Streptomyces sp. ISL-87]MBT2610492.1 hypothetical protein [Streptomyces sp. ISL-87]